MLLHIPTEYYPMQPTLSGLGAEICFVKVSPMVTFSNVGTRDAAGTLKGKACIYICIKEIIFSN